MREVLSLTNITKFYGAVRALNNVSLTVPEGSVFGVLGPNGSGKTTLLSIILDVLRPHSGSYRWFGQQGSPQLRKQIGSLLETPNFYHYLSGVDNLKVTQSISGRGDSTAIETVLQKVKLHERRKSRFKTYSLGMKQRLAIAAALLGDPQVLVLDEPTNGLDPVGIAEIRALITELRQLGHTIIIASHLLDEVEKVCTHVAILKTGELITSGEVNDILQDEDLVELAANDLEALAIVCKSRGYRVKINPGSPIVEITLPKGQANLGKLNQFCFDQGIVLTHLALKKKKLETRFFELTNGN